MELSLLIEEFIKSYGLISIFIIVALEYANAPLPSELVLPLVGMLALKFNMNLAIVIIVSTLGGLIGSVINYYLGFKLGEPLLAFVKTKYPKTKKSIKASYRWISKYNKASVMLSRLVPLARTFISIVAGVTRMSILSFVIYSGLGIFVWNTALIVGGYIIGDNMALITSILKHYSKVMIILGLIVGVVYLKMAKNKKKHSIQTKNEII